MNYNTPSVRPFVHPFIHPVSIKHLHWPGTAVSTGETGENKIRETSIFRN